jgi:hypothetical protein
LTAGVASLMALLSAGCLGGISFPWDWDLGSSESQPDMAASFPIPGSRSRKQADQAARQGLATLRVLVTNENFHDLGFQSLAQARRARLGLPMGRYLVRLDELQEYAPGEDPTPLFHREQRVIYPVRADGKTRSSVGLTHGKKGWTAAAWGGANRIRTLTAVRIATAQADGRNVAEYFEVTIPALNLTFIGSRVNNQVFLTPIANSARFGFVNGVTLTAENVFTAVLPAAQSHSGLPS